MKKLTSKEIRKMWLDYFSLHGHQIVPSASLIPKDDDSLLWINAGVTPLKRYFDGSEVPSCKRLTNLQKCIRTNDIENVGVTRRHHTFFEMMGNFSIGDYFKNEALEFAFELLTSEEWFNIPKELLYVTVFPNDIDTINKWISLGMNKEHIIKLEDNFWEIGPGPCGPDTEIFFDRGEKYDKDGTALAKFKNNEDNERYVEIWNNVFSQFNSEKGKKREEYKELPSKNIDTGAGLERWACIFQDVDSNFDTDLFMPIINQIEEISGVVYDGSKPFKVLADHIRTLTFALADGASFGNVGRDYILRRLLRRSVRYGRKLGLTGLFVYKLVDSVVNNMKDVYPYLIEHQPHVKALIMQEEELFNKTLVQGEKRLYELMDESIDNTISGYDAFKLYDTYGFPFELTMEYLEEKGFTTKKDDFDKYMNKQKKLSKTNQKHTDVMQEQNELLLNYKKQSEFIYDKYKLKSKILDLIDNNTIVNKLTKEGYVILDKTCFYATSGGQVNDTGMIIGNKWKARVMDVTKAPNGEHIHKVKILNGIMKTGDSCELILDETKRKDIEANHSSVHLLQYALRKLVSGTITQAGSKVDENELRFDFNYQGKIIDEDLIKVEDYVNDLIHQEIKREVTLHKIDDINKNEVMALFTEKYHDIVRLVEFNESKELCGGSHVKNTKEIGQFSILAFENKGSNTYRIVAATNGHVEEKLLLAAKPYNDEIIKLIIKAKSLIQDAKSENIKLEMPNIMENNDLHSYKDIINLKNQMQLLQNKLKDLEKKYLKAKDEKIIQNLSEYIEDMEEINGLNLILKRVKNTSGEALKQLLDNIANQYANVFILVANMNGDNVSFIARSNSKLNAGLIVKEAAIKSLGNGGGSDKFAQGGGKTLAEIDNIFNDIRNQAKDL